MNAGDTAVVERRLRVTEIPQMVDVDGHIEEQLLRYGQGVTVRPMFQVIAAEDFEWSPDEYSYIAADAYLPQPRWALDGWEVELYGVQPPSRMGCTCPDCARMRRWLTATYRAAPEPSPDPALELRWSDPAPLFSAGRLWFVPDMQRAASSALADLERAIELLTRPESVVVGFDGTRQGAEITHMLVDEAQLARRFRLNRTVLSTPPLPTIAENARQHALELRQSRGTGPAEVPFRRRGAQR